MSDAPLLSVRELDASYGDFQALFGLSMEVKRGEAVAVIGANGAGKSTLLKTIAGLLPARPDAITFAGESIGGKPAFAVAARGIALVPEGRGLFPSLSVEENLLIGGQRNRPPAFSLQRLQQVLHAVAGNWLLPAHSEPGPWTLPRVYELFPALAERRHLPSTALSGGQQQMAAIGRGLMSNPQLLLCDEISLGLAPIVVRDIYARLPLILAQGTSIVLVEQDVVQALKAAQRVYCLQEGRVALAGAAKDLTRETIAAAYFGL
jgi:branched-chain amino acid transport system ATP-binding protein